MFANLTGVVVGFEESALTINAEASLKVVFEPKTTPRGLFALKKSTGIKFGAEKVSGTPSQFISRLPFINEPPTPLFAPPRSVRNWSTVDWIAAAFAPEAVRTTGAAEIELIAKSIAKMLKSRFFIVFVVVFILICSVNLTFLKICILIISNLNFSYRVIFGINKFADCCCR